MRKLTKGPIDESGGRIDELGDDCRNVDRNLGDGLVNGVGYGFSPSEEEGTKLGEKQLLALLDRTVITKGSFVPGTKEELMMA